MIVNTSHSSKRATRVSVGLSLLFILYKFHQKKSTQIESTHTQRRTSDSHKQNVSNNLDHESKFKTPKDSKYYKENEILKSDPQVLKCNYDMYNGVRVFSTGIPKNAQEFGKRLEYSLDQWCLYNKRGIIIQIPINLIPTHLNFCISNCESKYAPFKLHHSRPEYIMLEKWLPNDPMCKKSPNTNTQENKENKENEENSNRTKDDSTNMIPDYCHTYLGVGCLILNKNCECVVIQELWNGARGKDYWKLPGGAVDRQENIYRAAEREAFEETGLKVDFVNILSFRHIFPFRFGNTGDIYFLTLLKLNDEYYNDPKYNYDKEKNDSRFAFNVDEKEIAKIRWIKLDELLNLKSMSHMVGSNENDNNDNNDNNNWEIRNVVREECQWLVNNWDKVSKDIEINKSENSRKENNNCVISRAGINGLRTFVPTSEAFKKRFAKRKYNYVMYHTNTNSNSN